MRLSRGRLRGRAGATASGELALYRGTVLRMTAAELTPDEIAAALAARRELGPEYEDAIAASLADRVEREIAARVDAGRIPAKREERPPREVHASDVRASTWLAGASLVAGIPVTAIVAVNGHGNTVAIGVAWAGIALVNWAAALGRRAR
jgi:hypothetical protein